MAEKEYIERDAVLDLLTNRDVVINPNDEVANIREDVEYLPAADVRSVVRGKWKTTRTILGLCCICSVCESCANTESRFCPYCGADMREA